MPVTNTRRTAFADGTGDVDWGLAEALAFGSLLATGTSIRLAGQVGALESMFDLRDLFAEVGIPATRQNGKQLFDHACRHGRTMANSMRSSMPGS